METTDEAERSVTEQKKKERKRKILQNGEEVSESIQNRENSTESLTKGRDVCLVSEKVERENENNLPTIHGVWRRSSFLPFFCF